ncbi:MAG: phosphatase PAP2 family protein [Bacteroidales bacterium]|nr:phosphatase PAP2 family protein [Bacteroidales bacterium]
MRKIIIFFAIIIFNAVTLKSQEADSLSISDKVLTFKPVEVLYKGTPLLVEGILMKEHQIDFRDFSYTHFPNFSTDIDTYTQFAPLGLTYALKLCGVESKSSWKDLVFATAFSYALGFGTIKAIKNSVYEKRPDISGNNSFPSGHTGIAFLNAQILCREYGQTSWWIPAIGYSFASATGIMRVMQNRHWIGDVVAGAGLGILATETSYFLKDLFLYREESPRFFPSIEESKEEKPSFVDIAVTFNHSFNKYKLSNNTFLDILDGAGTGIEATYFYNKHIGTGILADYSAYKLKNPNIHSDSTMSFYFAGLSQYFSFPICHRVYLGARAGVGINHIAKNNILNGIVPSQFMMRYNLGLNLSFWVQRNALLRFFADYTHSDLEIENQTLDFKTINLGAGAAFHF